MNHLAMLGLGLSCVIASVGIALTPVESDFALTTDASTIDLGEIKQGARVPFQFKLTNSTSERITDLLVVASP